jgi:hypothetical protein
MTPALLDEVYGVAMKTAPAIAPPQQQIHYQLESITRIATPDDCDGDWYAYVISQGKSLINGSRPGTRDEVQAIVQDMVDRLNERSVGKVRAPLKPARK